MHRQREDSAWIAGMDMEIIVTTRRFGLNCGYGYGNNGNYGFYSINYNQH